jgi:hypothetical protein
MYKKIDKALIYSMLIILIVTSYLTFTSTWLANDINNWQMNWMGEREFYPVLTMGLLFIPPMLVLLPIKLYIKSKMETKSREIK